MSSELATICRKNGLAGWYNSKTHLPIHDTLVQTLSRMALLTSSNTLVGDVHHVVDAVMRCAIDKSMNGMPIHYLNHVLPRMQGIILPTSIVAENHTHSFRRLRKPLLPCIS